jgi:spoIIIJ-associated protein
MTHDAPVQAQERSPAPPAMDEELPAATQTAAPRYERREMTHEERPMREAHQDPPREEHAMGEERQDSFREERPMRQELRDPPREERSMREERHDTPREERPMREDRPMHHAMREERHHHPAATATAEPPLSPDALAAEGKRWTEELLKAMGFEAKVSATAEEDRVDVTAEVSTGDELLTGPKGEVRQALQHLLNRMVNRGEGSRYHLQLEINDFWKRREDELREMAARLADEAIATSSEVVTEYLNAQERRIIHVTLREDARVKTYALGDGMIKRLAVAPADHPEGSREGD